MNECPVCGKRENRRGDAFDSEEAVVSHISGSHDPDHKHLNGEDFRGEIPEVDPVEEVVETDQSGDQSNPDPEAGGVEQAGSEAGQTESESEPESGSVESPPRPSEGVPTESETDTRDDPDETNGEAPGASGGGLALLVVGILILLFGQEFLQELPGNAGGADGDGPRVV